jgi:glutaryl-CoA dehydrogenase
MAGVGRFNWADPLLLDGKLSKEERLVRDTARGYARDRLLPRIVEALAHEHTDPTTIYERAKWGGIGPGYVAYGLVGRVVEAGRRAGRALRGGETMPADPPAPASILSTRQRSCRR